MIRSPGFYKGRKNHYPVDSSTCSHASGHSQYIYIYRTVNTFIKESFNQ